MLEQAMRRYQNRALEAAQVIEELIGLAREMRAAEARGEGLGLTDDELAFYDALEVNDSAVKVLGDETLRTMARELVIRQRMDSDRLTNLLEVRNADERVAVRGEVLDVLDIQHEGARTVVDYCLEEMASDRPARSRKQLGHT